MSIVNELQRSVTESLGSLYGGEFSPADFQINLTKPEFEGDYTVVLFSLLKKTKKSPDALGQELGNELISRFPALYSNFNLIKGFLNVSISDNYWKNFLDGASRVPQFGKAEPTGRKIMVEYASPNTNKPLHLGHLRNIFLGWSVAEILKTTGNEVIKSAVVNDRGIHICKSMIAWQRFANGATPESAGEKGDHLVGDYYVKFNDAYKDEMQSLIAGGMSEKDAEKEAPIMKATQKMLLDWEAGEPETISLWKKMNGWVYDGFDKTYRAVGADFDKTYYESNTYLLGKDIVAKGLQTKVFYKHEDGSVRIDLTAEGLDEKVVLRKDGTSVYITQDIGLARQKYDEFGIDESIYVIGDEQNHHMKVLKLIAQKSGLPYADTIHHLSYGMVELTTGKMKSREGTVVDADDLVSDMLSTAKQHTEELGKVADFSPEELTSLYETIGLGAMKFYLLRVDPKKRMIFNPAESIDFHGFTGPFVQYTYARIKSILRRAESGEQKAGETLGAASAGAPPLINQTPTEPLGETPSGALNAKSALLPAEKELLVLSEQFPQVLKDAGAELDPSKVAVYVFNLAQKFNSFYSAHSVSKAETEEKKTLRLQICVLVANILKTGLHVLGINAPERM